MNLLAKITLKEIKENYGTDKGISIKYSENGAIIPLDELSDEDLLNAKRNFDREVEHDR